MSPHRPPLADAVFLPTIQSLTERRDGRGIAFAVFLSRHNVPTGRAVPRLVHLLLTSAYLRQPGPGAGTSPADRAASDRIQARMVADALGVLSAYDLVASAEATAGAELLAGAA